MRLQKLDKPFCYLDDKDQVCFGKAGGCSLDVGDGLVLLPDGTTATLLLDWDKILKAAKLNKAGNVEGVVDFLKTYKDADIMDFWSALQNSPNLYAFHRVPGMVELMIKVSRKTHPEPEKSK